MIAVLLFILKILLYVLLGLIGLVLFVLLIVLVVPIEYKVKGSRMDTLEGHAVISWLFKILWIKLTLKEGDAAVSIRLFGIPIKKITQKAKTDSKEASSVKKAKPVMEKNKSVHKAETPSDNRETVEVHTIEKSKRKNKDKNVHNNTDNEMTSKKDKPSHSASHHSKNKKTSVLDTNNTIKEFLSDENKKVLKKIVSSIIKILKHILPNQYQIYLIIGNEDPATTGYIVGALSIFYSLAANNIKIVPDFEQPGFRGSFAGKGSIYNFVVVKYILKLILDKEVRTFIKEVKGG